MTPSIRLTSGANKDVLGYLGVALSKPLVEGDRHYVWCFAIPDIFDSKGQDDAIKELQKQMNMLKLDVEESNTKGLTEPLAISSEDEKEVSFRNVSVEEAI